MNRKTKRIFWTAMAPATVILLFWLFGFNFDARGFALGYCGVCCIFSTAFMWGWPGWRDDQS